MKETKDYFKIDFIGIGTQRAGTTWIANCLSAHPQICLSNPKEVHFFGSVRYSFGLDWYKKHFSAKPNQITGEFDAGYFASKNAAIQIKEHFPDVKIIISLRNPIEKAFSNYLSVSSYEKYSSFENFLEANPKILERGIYYPKLYHYLSS